MVLMMMIDTRNLNTTIYKLKIHYQRLGGVEILFDEKHLLRLSGGSILIPALTGFVIIISLELLGETQPNHQLLVL